MQPVHASIAPKPAMRRRWIAIGFIALLLLAIYAAALAWVSRRLEIDVQKSIHPVPAAVAAQRAGD